MNVQERYERTSHIIRLRLADNVEALPPNYKSGLFRPETVTTSYVLETGDTGWRLESCNVSGRMLKKDGSLGQMTGDRRFSSYRSGLTADTPDWLRQLVAEHLPPKLVSE